MAIWTPQQRRRLEFVERELGKVRIPAEQLAERLHAITISQATEVVGPPPVPEDTEPQTLYPVQDITTTDWVIENGSGLNFFDKLDDDPAHDSAATSIAGPALSSTVTLKYAEFKLGRLDGNPVLTPSVDTGHTLAVTVRADPNPTDSSARPLAAEPDHTVRCDIYQGGLLKMAGANQTFGSTTFSDYTDTMTEAEAASISDYDNLRVRIGNAFTTLLYAWSPTADNDAGAWSASTGSDLYAMLDEFAGSGTHDSDTTYVTTGSSGGSAFSINFASEIKDPVSDSGTNFRIHITARNVGAGGMDQSNWTVKLMDPTTVRATDTFSLTGNSYQLKTFILSDAEMASIVNFDQLRLSIEAEWAGATSLSDVRVTEVHLRIAWPERLEVTRAALSLPA